MIEVTIHMNTEGLALRKCQALWADLQKRLASFINRLDFDASFTRAEHRFILRLEISNHAWDESNLFERVCNIVDNWEAANDHSGCAVKLPWHK